MPPFRGLALPSFRSPGRCPEPSCFAPLGRGDCGLRVARSPGAAWEHPKCLTAVTLARREPRPALHKQLKSGATHRGGRRSLPYGYGYCITAVVFDAGGHLCREVECLSPDAAQRELRPPGLTADRLELRQENRRSQRSRRSRQHLHFFFASFAIFAVSA